MVMYDLDRRNIHYIPRPPRLNVFYVLLILILDRTAALKSPQGIEELSKKNFPFHRYTNLYVMYNLGTEYDFNFNFIWRA